MNQHILAKELLNYIKNLQIDQNLNDWICKGKTDITYGSPNGGWGKENGYLFEKKDKSYSYVLRSDVEHKGNKYIVIESLNLKGQLYNLDLSNPKIFYEKDGWSHLLESYVMTAGMGRKKDIDVKKSFYDLGTNTNEISIINDIKPDWSKALNDILEWAIIREKVKLDLKNNNNPINTRFAQIIEGFKKYISDEKTKIKDFSFQKTHRKYVWINDSEEKIGKKGFCHYELITRDKYPNKIFVEIHFDQKYKKNFENLINPHLNDKVDWNKEHESEHKELSLAFNENYNFEDGNLFSKLAEAFYYLESNFGELIRNEFQNIFKVSTTTKINMTKQPLNQILYGPPGTGKTYATKELAVNIVSPIFIKELDTQLSSLDKRKVITKEYDRLFDLGQIVFTTFHQSMSYEDFIEGIKPETNDGEISYDVKKGIFRKLCIKAGEREIKSNNFEESYRLLLNDIDNSESKSLILETLIHSKEFTIYKNSKNNIKFHANTVKAYEGVIKKEVLEHYLKTGETLDWPSYVKALGSYIQEKYKYKQSEEINYNPVVLIIDEINRGNVSAIFGELITLLEEDKRIGENEELRIKLPYSKDPNFGIPSNLYIIGTMNTADRSVEALDTALRRRFSFSEIMPNPELLKEIQFSGFNLSEVLKTINERIEVLLDRDHTVGHSYFLKVKSRDTIGLKSVFKNNIFPLLQEYFYHDNEKIALILGEGFVRVVENQKVNFAKFRNIDVPEVSTQFELIDKIEDIEVAVQLLLNRNV
nr:AAA family ATPase [uncultured Flavobacterium sp.]